MLSIRTAKNVQKMVQDYFKNIQEFPRDALIWGRRYVAPTMRRVGGKGTDVDALEPLKTVNI